MSRVCDNGVYRDLTDEEMQNTTDSPEVEVEITDTERIEALEKTTKVLSDEIAAAKIILGVE